MKEVILITGATSDLAFEYLNLIKAQEKIIIAFYYDLKERLEELKNSSLEIIPVFCDFSDTNDVSNKVVEISKKYDINTVLHFASPRIEMERFNKKEIKDYEIHFKIQFLSIVEILKNILPKMKKQKKGKVIFILSSVTFSKPPKFWIEYVSMKYALLGLLKSLVSEYGEYGIQFNGVSPSMIDSKLLDSLDPLVKELSKESHPLKELITKKEIVEFIDFLVKNDSKFLTGNNFNLSGGESI